MLVRIIVGAIVAAIIFFMGGWLLYGVALHSYFDGTLSATARTVMNTEPNFGPLAVSELAFGLLFSYVLVKWASMRTFVGGAIGGATMIFLMSFAWDMQMSAFFKDMHVGSTYVPMIVDLLCAIALGALAGGAIGLINGSMDKQVATS